MGRRERLGTGTSLRPELLSGRSLRSQVSRPRWRALREHRGWIAAGIGVVLVVAAVLGGKAVAERTADRVTTDRAEQISGMLAGASPEEFLAFNAGVRVPGSLAERVRDEDGFVSVDATAARSFIRFQPSGWWAGFTERCIVAVLGHDELSVTVPKTTCIRVEAPPS